jgi:hypothetical protein
VYVCVGGGGLRGSCGVGGCCLVGGVVQAATSLPALVPDLDFLRCSSYHVCLCWCVWLAGDVLPAADDNRVVGPVRAKYLSLAPSQPICHLCSLTISSSV